jgi:hypothetical protein
MIQFRVGRKGELMSHPLIPAQVRFDGGAGQSAAWTVSGPAPPLPYAKAWPRP